MLTNPSVTKWACTDCAALEANGDLPETPTEYAPMSLLADTDTVTAGRLDHSEYCRREVDGECDCETREFSKSACDLCGSPYHGARHAVTVWYGDTA